ncbi:MAG TPA: hypothetical protein VFH34_12885 [Anaerolineales bacterium]|nr:hypothetical protein [Anaerolineales bacterium]
MTRGEYKTMAESSVVYKASNGLKGLLVDAYGAYANWKTGALLTHTKDTHGGVDDAAARSLID